VAFGGWGGLPKRDVPLSMSRRDEAFWFAPLEDSDALYIQYNAVRSSTTGGVNIRTFANDIRAAVAQHDYERVILDMRHNPGGDNTTFGLLLAVMQEIGATRPGRLIVITSRRTFSAAANFATELEKTDGVIFVGEPMGGSPNLYGDTRPVRLPNSGLTALISSRYWERSTPDDTRDTITPDVIVPSLAADWFAGRDPLLDAALTTTKN
jgi:C-terminal processing protease CtpA/Prc